jgi:hypothetical protein
VPFLVGEQLIEIEARELSVLLFQIPLRVGPIQKRETQGDRKVSGKKEGDKKKKRRLIG